ncbi:MAG TPA: hypothetical protein VLH10_25755 [Yinghuangia sp.]|nr:hypothetical protein [Yinghuangia sp.]
MRESVDDRSCASHTARAGLDILGIEKEPAVTFGDLMALESRWTVLLVLIALGAMELFGLREMRATRDRRAAARRAFEDGAPLVPRRQSPGRMPGEPRR